MTRLATHKESADDYGAVIARLNVRWRVIVCKDGIQWIVQKRTKKPDGARWYGRSYCCTKKALIRVCQADSGEIEPSAMVVLDALPDRIGRRA